MQAAGDVVLQVCRLADPGIHQGLDAGGPFPARLQRGPTKGYVVDGYGFHPAFLETACSSGEARLFFCIFSAVVIIIYSLSTTLTAGLKCQRAVKHSVDAGCRPYGSQWLVAPRREARPAYYLTLPTEIRMLGALGQSAPIPLCK